MSFLDNHVNNNLSNLTTTGKKTGGSLSFPSDYSVTLTIGASGTKYTAPADGWVDFRGKLSQALLAYIALWAGNIALKAIPETDGSNGGKLAAIFLPVKKGDQFKISYGNLKTSDSDTWLRFFYDVGSV